MKVQGFLYELICEAFFANFAVIWTLTANIHQAYHNV